MPIWKNAHLTSRNLSGNRNYFSGSVIMPERVEALTLYRHTLDFSRTLNLADLRLKTRRVLLLKWRVNGQEVYTEVAPLPGFSEETLDACEQQIRMLFSGVESVQLDAWGNGAEDVSRKLEVDLGLKLGGTQLSFSGRRRTLRNLFPSVNFAIGSLLMAYQQLQRSQQHTVNSCTLLTENDWVNDTKRQRNEMLSAQQIVKLKVGAKPLDDDVQRIRRICDSFTGRLRLDANQQWTSNDVERLCQSIDCNRIEWLEDPLSDSILYKKWCDFCPIPFAYDETLYQREHDPVWNKGLQAFILKPSLLGYSRTQSLSVLARQYGCRQVLSSSFESAVGIQLLHTLAANLAPDEVHGLDTLKYFSPLSSMAGERGKGEYEKVATFNF